MESNHEILVCGEIADGQMTSTTRELLSLGRSLADGLHQSLNTLIIGKDLQELSKEAIAFGADRVYSVDSTPFSEFHPDSYTVIIAKVCQQIAPSVILLGQTDIGRDVAPRLAARLGIPVTLDCTELNIDPVTKQVLQTKPVYGGNAMAVWVTESNQPQIVTIRPRSVTAHEPDASRKGEIIAFDVMIDDSVMKSRLLENMKETLKGIKLEEAKVIVAGGGGIGGAEGFTLLEELTQVLGGTIGVTRVPCDEGWMSVSLEIGQTGHMVSPDLYIAVGISGALQHMAGCSGSKLIVAINRDPEAHIFKEANIGVVGDYRDVLPILIAKLKEFVKT
jgi:electron transfer flavoprotein alpha subunit